MDQIGSISHDVLYYEEKSTILSSLLRFSSSKIGFISILDYTKTEDILKLLYDNNYNNIESYPKIVYGIDEKDIITTLKPEVWENILVGGTYFSYYTSHENIILLSYLYSKFGSYIEMLCSLSMNTYNALKIIEYGVENTLTTSAKTIRYNIYDENIYVPEGYIKLYTSNHIDHTLSIGKVSLKDNVVTIIEGYSNSVPCTPTVYSPMVDGYYKCDWSNDNSIGKTDLNFYNIYLISDYDVSPEGYAGLFLAFQSSVVNINRDGGIFGVEIVFSFETCPINSESASAQAIRLKNSNTIAVFTNCDHNIQQLMAQVYSPTDQILISLSINVDAQCEKNMYIYYILVCMVIHHHINIFILHYYILLNMVMIII